MKKILDTDSLCLCLTGEFENLVKPEMRLSWNENYSTWFVKDASVAEDLRCPGKLKREWSTANGGIIW